MLANVEDLETFLGTSFTDAQLDRAELVLEAASGLFVTYADGQVIEEVEETVRLDGNGTQVLLLPQLPVTAVESVEVDGEALTEDDHFRWSEKGILQRVCGRWPDLLGVVSVTYTHGYPEVPQDVKLAVLRAAARTMRNPAGAGTETVGAYTVGGTQVLFGVDEIRVAWRYQG
jgi:hypothetical protein